MTRRRPVRYPGAGAARVAGRPVRRGSPDLGRPKAFLADHAATPGVRYLACAGLEEIRHDQLVVDPHLAPARPAVAAAAADLRERPAVRDSGAWLEDKRDAVADHIRRCRPQTSWGPPAVGDSGIC